MRLGTITIFVFVVVLTFLGFGMPLIQHHPSSVDPNYLLTVLSTVGTFGGIAFALYGWYTSKEIPKMVEKSAKEQAEKFAKELNDRFYKQQEAMQKVIASYQVRDSDRKIALLKQAVEQDETVYNAYVALGYAYWYGEEDFVSAQECFEMDLKLHPDNYQSASDLAALHATLGEATSAIRWIKATLQIRPETWADFEKDSRFDKVRESHKKEYDNLISKAKQ